MFEEEIKNLTMTPDKWSKLNKMFSCDEYRKIVNDYQNHEWQQLPMCKRVFGICRYYSCGRCTCKDYCHHKKSH